MKRILLCALVAVLPLAACKRKPAAAPPEAETPAAPPNPTVDLKVLNDAVRAYTMGQLKDPAGLDDLVKAGFIKRLPTAPPGKKYVLDAKKSAVQLVDQ